ncbi:hypothetical protein OG612_44895 (plasmid) [Streptomyces sp. NBC_01527]|uniref:hypothetical protein n=1 Tax=Streptomyces sp. NBC_01527 TaxID=2903894 RepID=UPI002F90A106
MRGATRILEEIKLAQRLAEAFDSTAPVRAKIDQNGLGHDAVDMLKTWAENTRHRGQIVGVIVSEPSGHDDPCTVKLLLNERAEMWLATRIPLQPHPATGVGRLRLRTDRNAAIQLTTPQLGYNSGGPIVVESRKSMKSRGMNSTDRAKAVLLAPYELDPIIRRGGLLV